MRSRPILALVALTAAALVPLPASAGHSGARISPVVYHSAAFYRALLLRRPPSYWAGGTMFVPLAAFFEPSPVTVAAAPPPRRPVSGLTLRVPDKYLEAALHAPHPGPLWVKTARGFRLDAAQL